MVVLVALLAVFAFLMWVVPAIVSNIARSVASQLDRSPSSGSIDQSVVEARLGRIEEAIDAMAVQIEKLADHQHALLGPVAEARRQEEESATRTDTPH